MNELTVLILAAGLGKRMKSQLPKVLHPIGGKAMLTHVVETAYQLKPKRLIIVYGQNKEQLQSAVPHHPGCEVLWAHQDKQLGTGHAVLCALPLIEQDLNQRVLILYADVPLIESTTLAQFLQNTKENQFGLLTAVTQNPQGFGRIVRSSQGAIEKIVEEKDATDSIRQIKEFNTGMMLVPANLLVKWVKNLTPHNAQQEYYLTDIVESAVSSKISVVSTMPKNLMEVLGVNSREQQMFVERCFQQRVVQKLFMEGVSIKDPARMEVRGELNCESDVEIDVNVIFEGKNSLGMGTKIGANSILIDSQLGKNVTVLPFSFIEGARIEDNSVIGPFARLRPGTKLAEGVRIGNFVEIKNAQIDAHSKINHLSYIGDAVVGKRVNVGAGTITCNFDGAHKHQTIIGDDAHIGSDTQLVAPVSVGEGATLAAGTTLTKDAPPGKLTMSQQLSQRTLENWVRPSKIDSDSNRNE